MKQILSYFRAAYSAYPFWMNLAIMGGLFFLVILVARLLVE